MLNALTTTAVTHAEPHVPVRVATATTLIEAVVKMRAADQGAVLIEDPDGRLLGILTERDLVRIVAASAGRNWRQDPVSQHMTPSPATVHPTTPIASVLHLMSKGSFRRLPIVDEAGHAIGIISVRDVLTYVAEAFPQEFANLPADPRHEARSHWGG